MPRPYEFDGYPMPGLLVTCDGYYGIILKHSFAEGWTILCSNGLKLTVGRKQFRVLPLRIVGECVSPAGFFELVDAFHDLNRDH